MRKLTYFLATAFTLLSFGGHRSAADSAVGAVGLHYNVAGQDDSPLRVITENGSISEIVSGDYRLEYHETTSGLDWVLKRMGTEVVVVRDHFNAGNCFADGQNGGMRCYRADRRIDHPGGSDYEFNQNVFGIQFWPGFLGPYRKLVLPNSLGSCFRHGYPGDPPGGRPGHLFLVKTQVIAHELLFLNLYNYFSKDPGCSNNSCQTRFKSARSSVVLTGRSEWQDYGIEETECR